MMSKKAAIELSMNFIVVIVISIVILGLGIALTRNIYNQAVKTQDILDKRTQDEIENTLRTSPVSLPFANQELRAGQSKIFGLGVKNVLGATQEFIINVSLTKTQPSNITTELVLSFEKDRFQLKDDEQRISKIIVAVPPNTERGIYTYSAKVQYRDNPSTGWTDYQTRNMYITVS